MKRFISIITFGMIFATMVYVMPGCTNTTPNTESVVTCDSVKTEQVDTTKVDTVSVDSTITQK